MQVGQDRGLFSTIGSAAVRTALPDLFPRRDPQRNDQREVHTSTEGLPFLELTAQVEEPYWLAAAQNGEPQALERLFQTYHGPVYALCYRMLSRADDAEDATQSTFVGAFRALAQFRGRSTLKTWLYRIAVNESLNLLRQRRGAPAMLPDDATSTDTAPDIVEKQAVQLVLQRMRLEQRLPLILFYWEELSCEEIAGVLNISVSAAKMRLKRAREEFQRQYVGER